MTDTPKERITYTRNHADRISVQFNATITKKIVALAQESKTSTTQWVTEIIELYILEHRSGKNLDVNPERYDDRDMNEDPNIYHL